MTPPGGSRGKPPVGPPSSYQNNSFTSTRCRCCPYGFHIDLDFVKFAENVTAGTDHVQKWNTNPRRFSKRRFGRGSVEEQMSLPRHYGGARSFDGMEDLNSTMDSSMSQSIAGGYMSATEDEPPTDEFPSFSNGYLSKNRSDSQVMKLIQELNGIENSRRPPIPPPLSSSTPYPGILDSFNQKHLGTGWNSGSSGVNAEIQDILSRHQSAREISKNATSAPTSPTPTRSYHLFVAQASSRKNSNSNNPMESQNPPPPPPRRYFDSARPRVLSPEPGARDTNLPPTMLRTSNLHSRSFFSNNGSPPDSGNSNRTIPYRSKMTTSFSGGLDFDSFASVRRQKTEDGGFRTRAFSPTAPGLKLDGYTSDAEYRTTRFSPPPIKQFYEYKNDEKTPEISTKQFRRFGQQQSFDSISSLDQKQTIVVEHRESQTTSPVLKNASTNPITRPISSQETQTNVLEAHVSTDTEDLETEDRIRLGKVLSELESRSKKQNQECSVEFQFALGHEPEHHPDEEPQKLEPKKTFVETGTNPVKKAIFNMGVNTAKIVTTDKGVNTAGIVTAEKGVNTAGIVTGNMGVNTAGIVTADKGCMPMPPPVKPKTSTKGVATDEGEKLTKGTQTEESEVTKGQMASAEIQTEDDWIELEVQKRLKTEKFVDKITEIEDSGEFIMITCAKCDQSSISDEHEHYQKIKISEDMDPPSQSDSIGDRESGFSNSSTDLEEFERIEKAIQEEVQRESPDLTVPPEPLVRHPMPPDPDYSDHDSVSLDTVSINTVINIEPMKVEKKEKSVVKTIDPSKIEALKKLLTEPRQNFSRDSGAYRSVKLPKAKTTDDLEYIENKHTEGNEIQESEMPSEGSTAGLTDIVMLKKALPTSPIPEPVPAKIPRPKISRYSIPVEQAATPDEEAEAADKLTPLRSELRSLAAWGSGGGSSKNQAEYRRYAAQQNQQITQNDDEIEGEIQNSGASSDSDATYDLSDDEENEGEFELTEPLKDALTTLNTHLKDADSIATQAVEWANKYVQHEWLKMTTKKKANAKWIENFLDALDKSYSVPLMTLIVNFPDNNGNTALHYAVSHENYDLVSVLLDSKVCDVDRMNHAGYSPVMLGSLCEIKDETQSTIVQRLFEIGNVNAKALKHGQTALQLAASHGRVQTTQLLLDCGADVNIQDVDGSTALMCAAEWGRKEIIKMLLRSPNIDASLTDCDNQTALSIAIEQKHKAIAVLIYAHLNFNRFQSGDHSTV